MIEIGRFWASGGAAGDAGDLDQELAEFAAPPEVIEQLRQEAQREGEFPVHPDNWQGCQLFLRLSTQWRIGMAGPTGLDHGVLFSLMDRQRIDYERQDELHAQVSLIERGALEAMRSAK